MTDYQKSNGAVDHEPFKATKIWNDIIEHLKTNVEQRRRRWKFQYFENCFRGGDMVEILHAYVQSNPNFSKDASRTQVRSLAQILLDKKVIECVASDVTKKDCFEDNNRLYRFSTESTETPGQVIPNTGLPAKVERRGSKRRSLLGIGDKTSTRRKSLSFTPKAQNRLVELLASSPSTLLSSFSSDQNGQESAKKRRRLSLDGGLGLRKGKLSALTGRTQDLNSDVWFEVALSELLYLTDVPFLENVLDAPVKEKNHGIEVIADSNPCVQIESQENSPLGDVWVAAGLDCIQLQSLYPLAQQGDMGHYTNILNITKSGVHQCLLEYYGSLMDTLIPANLSDLVEGILCLLATDRTKKTVSALQLLIMLLPVNNRKHMRKLLNFMGNSSERFVMKKFMNTILPKNVTTRNTGYKLVAFMTKHQSQIFKVPAGLKAFIARCSSYEQKGLCRPLLSTACHQVSVVEYEDQTRLLTVKALNKLITDVIEDLSMSLKDKEEQLKLFQKHHNEIFLKQFPSVS